jgi:hypothetical protein
MNESVLAAHARQMVLDHFVASYGMKAGAVELLPLAPRNLPEGAAEFFVETRVSHGHGKHNCIVMGSRVYCSGAEGEFSRLLREQALLERKDLSAARLMRLYSLFALPRQLRHVDANVLIRNRESWRAYPEVVAPTLTRRPDGGVTLCFYATPLMAVQPSKWTVDITRGYGVEVRSALVAPR